jgi:hypothetical protein
VNQVRAGHHLEELTSHVYGGSGAGRRHIDFVPIIFGIGDEFGYRRGRNRGMNLHNIRNAADTCDRSDVADEIEVELVIERRVDRVRRGDQKERVAIRGRSHDRLSADIAAGPRPILNDERLDKPLRQPLADQARHYVCWPPRRERNDNPYWPRRICLRPCDL